MNIDVIISRRVVSAKFCKGNTKVYICKYMTSISTLCFLLYRLFPRESCPNPCWSTGTRQGNPPSRWALPKQPPAQDPRWSWLVRPSHVGSWPSGCWELNPQLLNCPSCPFFFPSLSFLKIQFWPFHCRKKDLKVRPFTSTNHFCN